MFGSEKNTELFNGKRLVQNAQKLLSDQDREYIAQLIAWRETSHIIFQNHEDEIDAMNRAALMKDKALRELDFTKELLRMVREERDALQVAYNRVMKLALEKTNEF